GAAVGFGGGELLALLDLAGDLHLRERVRHERAARPVLGAPAPVQQGEPDHLRRGGDNTRSHNSFPRVRVALSALGGPLGGALFRRGLTVHFGARVPRQRLLGGLYLRSRGGRRSGDGRGRGVLRVGYGFGRGRGGRLWQPRLPPLQRRFIDLDGVGLAAGVDIDPGALRQVNHIPHERLEVLVR